MAVHALEITRCEPFPGGETFGAADLCEQVLASANVRLDPAAVATRRGRPAKRPQVRGEG